jgi:hypothetical protein
MFSSSLAHLLDAILIILQVVSSRPGTPLPVATKGENGLAPKALPINAASVKIAVNGLEEQAENMKL